MRNILDHGRLPAGNANVTYVTVVGSVLIALLFVVNPMLEKGTRAVVTSDRVGLPKPWHPNSIQTFAAAPAPAPDMMSPGSCRAKVQSAPEVVAKVEPAARAATAEATHKKKRVTHRQPRDDYRQSYGWSRHRIGGVDPEPSPGGGGEALLDFVMQVLEFRDPNSASVLWVGQVHLVDEDGIGPGMEVAESSVADTTLMKLRPSCTRSMDRTWYVTPPTSNTEFSWMIGFRRDWLNRRYIFSVGGRKSLSHPGFGHRTPSPCGFAPR